MKYRIAICDDDRNYAKQIENFISLFCNDKSIKVTIKLYTESDKLMYSIEKRLFYDLYILDIEMPVYSGFDILKELDRNQVKTDVILLTAHIDYAVEAHNYSQVFRYIPKTFITEKMGLALKDFFIKMEQKLGCRPYTIENKILSVKIYQEDVTYIYKDKKYAVFVMCTGEMERERCALQIIHSKLNNPDMIMLDRSYIINVRHIRRIQSNEVILEGGESIHTSREHIIELKNAFNQYWGDLT